MNTGTLTRPVRGATDLEKRLHATGDPLERFRIVHQLVESYLYTNTHQAEQLLEVKRDLLDRYGGAEFEHGYYHQLAVLRNLQVDLPGARGAFERALRLSEDYATVSERSDIQIDYTGTLINLKQYEPAELILNRVAELLEEYPDPELKFRMLTRRAMLHHLRSGDRSEIVVPYHTARDIYTSQKLSDNGGKNDFYYTLATTGLGNITFYGDDAERAAELYREVINLCEATGLSGRLCSYYINVGNAYDKMGDLEQAKHFFQRAMQVPDGDPESRATSTVNLGRIYADADEWDRALKMFNEAERLYERSTDPNLGNLSRLQDARGDVFAAQDNYQRATKLYQEALTLAVREEDHQQCVVVYQKLSDMAADRGRWEEAYHYLSKNHFHRDELAAKNLRYENQKREAEHHQRKMERESERLKLEAGQLQLRALRNQMDPHFIFNAMNAVQSYISGGELQQAGSALNNLATLMRMLLDNSDESNLSVEDEIDFLRNYLKINAELRFDNSFTYSFTVDPEIEDDLMQVPNMVLQPFLENAIEHGFRLLADRRGHLDIRFDLLHDDLIICTITDNGVGRERARQRPDRKGHKSKGLSITRRRLRLLLDEAEAGRDPVLIEDLHAVKNGKRVASGTRVKILLPVLNWRG